MLSKAIRLNLKIGKSDFSKAIGFSVAGYLSATLFSQAMQAILIGPILLLICTIVSIVFSIKGLNKICSSSLFNEEGSFYMALPLSEKETVMGKILAGSIYMLLLDLVSLAAALIIVFISGMDSTDLGVELMQQYLDVGVPSVQVGILTGLLPLKMLLQQVFFCSFAMAVLLFFNLIRPGKLSVIAWLAIFGINALLSKGLTALSGKLIENGFSVFLLEGLTDILYAAVIFGLFSYCVKSLGTKYNL